MDIGEWIYGAFKKIVDVIWDKVKDFFTWIWELIVAVGTWLWDFVEWVIDAVAYFLCYSFDTGFSLFADTLDWFIDYVIPAVPFLTSFIQLIQPFGVIVSTVDLILPVTEIFSCVAFYFVLLLVWVVYKFIKSWIPTVSGS